MNRQSGDCLLAETGRKNPKNYSIQNENPKGFVEARERLTARICLVCLPSVLWRHALFLIFLLSSCALKATMIVLRLIRTAPTAGLNTNPVV